jgi:hypothetical protein
MKIIDWRRSKKPLMLETAFKKSKKLFSQFSKLEGATLQTNIGIFISNGEKFVDSNGTELDLKSNPKVALIYIPQDVLAQVDSKTSAQLLSKLEPEVKEHLFSYTDIRLGLYELCGIEDHSRIWKAYNIYSPAQIIDTDEGLALKINSKYNTKYNDRFISEVLAAGKFFKFATEHYSELSDLLKETSFNKAYVL